MTNKELAQATHRAYSMLLKDVSWKATTGDKNAAMDVIKLMTARNLVLRSLGFELNDTGRLVKYVKRPEPEEVTLAKLAAEGDTNAARTLLERMTCGPRS